MYQAPEALDNSRTGLGLGLYIAKELVELHGGRISVTSQVGEGSIFTFTLPRFSLGKLLTPLITLQGRLRDALVLIKVEVSSPSTTAWTSPNRSAASSTSPGMVPHRRSPRRVSALTVGLHGLREVIHLFQDGVPRPVRRLALLFPP